MVYASHSLMDCETRFAQIEKECLAILFACKRFDLYLYDDMVLRHTLPIFMGLGRCPIVNWDFAGALSIFGLDALPSCRPPMTFTGIRTRDFSSESCSS